MAAVKGIVQFDYVAEAPDELTLRVGDVITNIKPVEDGWCNGVLNGRTGAFPDNFVKVTVAESKMVEERPAPPPNKAKKKDVVRRMKVTFAYEPANEDELRLDIGDIIEVLLDEEEGWAKGMLKGHEGVFPTNFAINVEEPPQGAAPLPLSSPEEPKLPPEDHSPVQPPKKVKGVGFGNIFGDGPIKLRQSAIGHQETPKKMDVDKLKPHQEIHEKTEKQAPIEKVIPPSNKKPPKVSSQPAQEKCRVMFDYPAENPDELSLMKGEIVVILDKKSTDVGWWEGEIVDDDGTKRRGVFPDNFVAPLPVEEETAPEKSSPKEARDNNKAGKSKPAEIKKQSSNSQEEKSTPNSKSKVKQLTNSLKRPAPQAPLVPVGITKQEKQDAPTFEDSDLAAVVDSTKTEPNLTHYKRASGPKNRRKPDTAGRRERAQQVTEEMDTVPAEPEEEPPAPAKTIESTPESNVPPKRETKRGVQVIPGGTGGEAGSDAPSWLQNLRSRNSQKKPQMPPLSAASPVRDEEPPQESTPSWLSNLKKSKSGSAIVPARPALPTTSPKPGTVKHTHPPAANHVPVRPPSPVAASSDKAQNKPQEKSEPEHKANAAPEPTVEVKPVKEVKKMPIKHVALQPPKQPEKKPVPSTASKPKPPPPKAKPMLPGAKPTPGAAAAGDDVREEIRSLKEAFNTMQMEHRKEMQRLHSDLEEERRQRMILQREVAQLKRD